MARIDKYEPMSGGFRAPLEADWPKAKEGVPTGVGLNANGRVVAGAGQTGVLGVVCVDKTPSPNPNKRAGKPVDVMTDGDLVECTGLVAGTVYFAAASDGVLSTTNTGTRVGATVEAERLVVRAAR